MIRHSIVLIAVLSLLAAPGASQERTKRKGPVVRQADRILVESGDPETLFKFFTETLQLPVARPLADQGTYISGSISTGDVTLELFRYGARKKTAATARYTGLYFEPYPIEDALQELRIIGIPYDPPQTHASVLPDGSEGTAWTTVSLPSLSSPLMPVSLFEYSPVFLDTAVRRQQLGNRLTLNNGGPLGIITTHAIVLESGNPEKTGAEWIRLLGKPGPDGDLHAVNGPAFRVVGGSANGIQRIVLKVKSLDHAEAFLKEQKLMGTRNKGELFINPSAVQGLAISLME